MAIRIWKAREGMFSIKLLNQTIMKNYTTKINKDDNVREIEKVLLSQYMIPLWYKNINNKL